MTFEYDELKEYIEQDFKMFYNSMKFSPAQVVPAILNEYEHAEDFSLTEKVCIYVFLSLIYRQEGLNNMALEVELNKLLSDPNIREVKSDLKEDYKKFSNDIQLCDK